MHRNNALVLIALCLSVCVPAPVLAQQGNTSSQTTAPQEKKPAIGAIATGWTYLYADQGGGERESINGWFLRPSVNVGRGVSVFADFTNYYGANRKGSLNSHGFTFGAAQQFFRKAAIKPSLFAEMGDVRSSSAGTITNQFAFAAGGSVEVPMGRHVSLVLTPAEWVFLYPDGDPRNDYNAKVGFSFPIGR